MSSNNKGSKPKASKARKKNTASNGKSKKNAKKSVKLPSLQKLLEAGSHFGHKSSRWNPAMERYIFDTRAGIHIIDLAQTMELLYRAIEGLRKASKKGNILLVGTKGQAATLIKNTGEDHGAYYISKRWPGGLMTNFKSVRKSVDKLMELEEDLAARRGYETKKERLLMERERDSLKELYQGIRFMNDMPSAMVVIDTRVEKNAIREAQKLGVKVVGLIDTNCDPNLVDYPVPANDDAIKSIELFVNYLLQGFSNSKTSMRLINRRNNYADRISSIRQRAKREEERRKREREREMKRLKAMKEGKEVKFEDKSGKKKTEGKVVRVKKKEDRADDKQEKAKKTAAKKSAKKKKDSGKQEKASKKAESKTATKEKKQEKKASKDEDAKSIEELELGTRITNALEDADIKTVDQLKEYDEDGLADIDGIGAVSVEKILDAIK
jgi:small subunit ribosomal protein S2